MIRVVIDTNVLVSGLLFPEGNEALVLLAVHHRWLCPCFSRAIVDEYAGVLGRPKFGFSSGEVAALLDLLRERGEELRPGAAPAKSPDPSDSKFLDCAYAADAEFLVTGNKRHFPGSPYGSTEVVSAAELLDRITLAI